ncbi:hypothetical protein LJC46_08135 [Desulfovibrio sp. OttesenSCG-928-G15]|nr:hypothetical protein [Desulfovibrio sp. OttesenSCG-928-G15]
MKLSVSCSVFVSISLFVAVLFFFPQSAAALDAVPVPAGISLPGPAAEALRQGRGGVSNDVIAASILGLPYRVDGALDKAGGYTLFADRTKRFNTPGLNCSGLVLQLSRMLLGKNYSLDDAVRDRKNDSGPDSPHGHDWDFGWDLILNVSEGFSRRFLMPGNKTMDVRAAAALKNRGFDCQKDATWKELSRRFSPGRIYLVSLNVEGRRKGYGLTHYHVGIVYVASTGEAWFYQTTGKGGGANRRDLKSREGQNSFKKAFANTGNNRRMMAVLEVDLPPR